MTKNMEIQFSVTVTCDPTHGYRIIFLLYSEVRRNKIVGVYAKLDTNIIINAFYSVRSYKKTRLHTIVTIEFYATVHGPTARFRRTYTRNVIKLC